MKDHNSCSERRHQATRRRKCPKHRLVAGPPPLPLMSTYDPRVDMLCRRLKEAVIELQAEAELDVLEGPAQSPDEATIQEMTQSQLLR